MRALFTIILVGCFLQMHLNNKRVSETFDTPIPILSYKTNILPIFQNRCSICHNPGTPDRNWLNYKTAYNKRSSLKMRLQDRTMPPTGFDILDKERQLVIDWVSQGAKP